MRRQQIAEIFKMKVGGISPLKKLLIIIHVYVCYVAAFGDVATIQELCPYATFCTSGPSKPLPSDSVMSCCFPCSCSDQCIVTGNCCHDKPGASLLGPEPRCRSQSQIHHQLLNRTMRFTKGPSYRVIDRCPGETSNVSNVTDSSNSCYRADDIADLVFVSDPNTFDVYLNRFCARCNGVENGISWYIVTRDLKPDILSVMSFQERDEYILQKASILNTPPTHDMGLHSVCFDSIVDRCNMSGHIKPYNPYLDDLCRKYNSVYLPPNDVTTRKYRNIYCYMCNRDIPDSTLDLCPIVSFDVARTVFPTLTTMIEFHPRSQPAARCSQTTVLDPFLDSCTYLYCPIGYIANYGTCEPIAAILYGFTLEFDLELHWAFTANDANDEELFNGIILLLEELKTYKCTICYVELYELTSGSSVARVTVTSTEQCTNMQMMRLVKRILSENPLHIYLFQSNINISAHHLLERSADGDAVLLNRRVMNRGCSSSIYIGPDTILCPTIQYQMSSLRKAGVPQSAMDLLKNVSSNLNTTDFRACVGTYRDVYDRVMTGGSLFNSLSRNCMILATIFHLISGIVSLHVHKA